MGVDFPRRVKLPVFPAAAQHDAGMGEPTVRFALYEEGADPWNGITSSAPRPGAGAAARAWAERGFVRRVFYEGSPQDKKASKASEGSPEDSAKFFIARLLENKRYVALDPEVKKTLRNLVDRHKTDPGFILGLRNLIDHSNFAGLSDPKQQMEIVEDIKKFIQTVSYLDGPKQLAATVSVEKRQQTFEGHSVDVADTQKMVLILGFSRFLVASAASDQPKHGRQILNNTKEHILKNEVPFGVFYENSLDGRHIDYGYTDEKGVHWNYDPYVLWRIAGTIAHEVNHSLNYLDTSKSKPIELFLAEYRAFLVGEEIRLKHTLTPQDEANIVKKLLTTAEYFSLKYAYEENSGHNPFHATIDVLRHKLAKGETVSAEQLRLGITTGWGQPGIKPIITPYLNKPGNDDNH